MPMILFRFFNLLQKIMNISIGPLIFKWLKKTGFLCFLFFCGDDLFAQQRDTLVVGPQNLLLSYLPYGKSTYLVYYQQPQKAAEKMVLVKINVTSQRNNGLQVVAIDQQWDADTVVHSTHTLLNLNNLSTLQHHFFWRRLGYSASYDFTNKEISYEGTVADSVRKKAKADFLESFEVYNLNWHSDLVLFPLLPYRDNRTFRINFFDPGFGKMRTVFYSVTGTDVLMRSSGEKQTAGSFN